MKKHLLIFGLITLFLFSCDKNENLSNITLDITKNIQSHQIIKSIRKLENPYSVSNMRLAQKSLLKEGIFKAPLEIHATHLYVRFMPENEFEYNLLKQDTLLTLFSHPLDCELTEGEFYFDSTIVDKRLQWFYTKVPIGYSSPINGYEVLDELYLPLDTKQCSSQDNNSMKVKESMILDEAWIKLEKKAFDITNNTYVVFKQNGANNAPNSWTPTATIRVQDESRNMFIGVAGIKVHARNWFNWEHGITDSSGRAVMSGTFNSTQIDWSFDWEGSHFNILQGEWMLQAGYTKTQKGHMGFDIPKGMMSYCYAHAFRACHDYWNNSLGLKIPFSSSFWKQKINIGVFDGVGTSRMKADSWVLGSRIKIYRFEPIAGGSAELTSMSLFEATIHELNHVSYWELNPDLMKEENLQLIESWAMGVQYAFSKLYYHQDTSKTSFQCARYHLLWSPNTTYKAGVYTPVVIDLLDDFNQDATYPNYSLVNDMVTGYTIAEVERAIKNTATLIALKQKLIDFYDNPTEEYLDTLFNFYIKK